MPPLATPNLMPFNIEHDGPAPVSTYFLVEAAPEIIARPTPESQEEEMEVDCGVVAGDQELQGDIAEATTRLMATFRGRAMHGLKLVLPEGYTGVIFNGDVSKTKVTTKPKIVPKSRQARATRGSAAQIDDEEREVVVEEALRTLKPAARFSSLVLWHPDIPVDPGRDEYTRALTEWIQLAHEIHHE